jgi:DNA-binding NarL/FixJ family response regulator
MSVEARQFAPRRSVVIIGQNSLQNRLLSGLIEQRSGCGCLVRSADGLNGFPFTTHALALVDIENIAPGELGERLQSLSARVGEGSIAVINAQEDVAFDQVVAWPRVKGVFFRDASQENLIKGIQAIFGGDYWLPRKILCQHLERTRSPQRPTSSEATSLTRKEVETLKLLATGNSTQYIAAKLNVSPHTVKTHIYNLFRKIRVSNRVQAAQWAMQNIDGLQPMAR